MRHYAPLLAYLVSLVAGVLLLAVWGDIPAVATLTGYAMGVGWAWFATVDYYRGKARRQARLDAQWIGCNA